MTLKWKQKSRLSWLCGLLFTAGVLILNIWVGSGFSWAIDENENEMAVLRLNPIQSIMTVGQRIGVEASLTAKEPLTLCLFEQPLTQFDWEILKVGEGLLSLEPLVVQFAPKDPFSVAPYLRGYDRWVRLKPGETYTFRLLLSRLTLAKGHGWQSGEYRISAAFRLCDPGGLEKVEGELGIEPEPVNTVPIQAQSSARFLLID